MDAVSRTPSPANEPVRQYQPGSHERAALESKIKELAGQRAELTMTIAGRQQMATGDTIDVVQPHNKQHVLGQLGNATDMEVAAAIYAAKQAAPGWRALDFDDRAAIFLKAADLLAGPWRATVNAATILGQSKSPYQAEIDAACELIDFWRYNVYYAQKIYSEQPESSPGTWNRMEYRPLEGFVLAITPFNFTSIAGNLPTAPALLGNVVVWKPSPTQQLAAHYIMRLLEAAGLPPGVINLVTGDGQAVSQVALTHPDLAGIHFTGSTATFQHLWRTVGENIARYRNYPRLVGETGGKDFVIVHPSADQPSLAATLIRGAFEYQGQKCSAASRAYVPESLWTKTRDDFLAQVDSLTMGDVAGDLSLFMGAVIDARAFAKHAGAIERAKNTATITVAAGGTYDDTQGFFVRPPSWSALTRPTRCSPPSTSARSWPCTSTRTTPTRRCWPRPPTSPLRADRRGAGHRPVRDRRGHGETQVLGGQLLHQRQAHRRGRRPAAVRRRPGQRHRRQGRLGLQPDPLGIRPRDQGTLRPPVRLPIPSHGLTRRAPEDAIHRLVLWNIDLTLVDVARVTRAAYAEAFGVVAGRPLVRLPQMPGRSESEIFFDALAATAPTCARAGTPSACSSRSAPSWPPRSKRRDELATQGQLLPGAAQALAAVAKIDGVVQTVLTGNSRQTAELKLRAFDLDGFVDFDIGGYGSEAYPKGTLLRVARQRAADARGVPVDEGAAVYIADSPRDVDAARIGGARSLAVASGRASAAELRESGADAVLPDLTDAVALTALIIRLTRPGTR